MNLNLLKPHFHGLKKELELCIKTITLCILHETMNCWKPGSAGCLMGWAFYPRSSMFLHFLRTTTHNNNSHRPASSSSRAMTPASCDRSPHPLFPVTTQVERSHFSLPENCFPFTHRSSSAHTVHSQTTFDLLVSHLDLRYRVTIGLFDHNGFVDCPLKTSQGGTQVQIDQDVCNPKLQYQFTTLRQRLSITGSFLFWNFYELSDFMSSYRLSLILMKLVNLHEVMCINLLMLNFQCSVSCSF